ncbi:hypothetical protein BpHYR1_004535 [Brachionus plicatilis]|uniref:Uncharacterized protein n=1 Tax=Brachionus plicatilis TaxID=10195 RepID=A0A3M7QA86_BRAPC|nr:hypothetical protein BpHYR1_004535 [Brachionus plicatilis]
MQLKYPFELTELRIIDLAGNSLIARKTGQILILDFLDNSIPSKSPSPEVCKFLDVSFMANNCLFDLKEKKLPYVIFLKNLPCFANVAVPLFGLSEIHLIFWPVSFKRISLPVVKLKSLKTDLKASCTAWVILAEKLIPILVYNLLNDNSDLDCVKKLSQNNRITVGCMEINPIGKNQSKSNIRLLTNFTHQSDHQMNMMTQFYLTITLSQLKKFD